MPVPVHRSSTRRRIVTIVGVVCAITVISVQAATGARTHAAGLASSTAAAAGGSDTTGALPADQPALDTAADDAQSVAGSAYYTGAVVNDGSDTVDVYLAGAPQSIIDQLQAMHPGTYVIHNDAAHPLSDLLKLEDALPLSALSAEGVDVISASPTSDGHLKVEVSATDTRLAQSVLQSEAQSTLGSAKGAGLVEVYGGAHLGATTGYRYNETPPWNGGDFIMDYGTDRFTGEVDVENACSSGIGVHKTGDPSLTYMLEAAHCAWNFGTNSDPGYGVKVFQAYDDSNNVLQGSLTTIGTVKYLSDLSSGSTSVDAALIPTGPKTQTSGTGYDVFKSDWNSSEYGPVTGVAENHTGDHVCQSGAYTGEICGLVVQELDALKKQCPQNWGYCYYAEVDTAQNPNNTSWVAVMSGDSGGPVYWKDTSGNIVARGMDEGGEDPVSCSSISTPPIDLSKYTCYNVLYFSGMDEIDGGFDVTPNQG